MDKKRHYRGGGGKSADREGMCWGGGNVIERLKSSLQTISNPRTGTGEKKTGSADGDRDRKSG